MSAELLVVHVQTSIHEQNNTASRMQQVGLFLAAPALTMSMVTMTPTAEAAITNMPSGDKQIIQACNDARFVVHRGVDVGKESVNSISWLLAEIHRGHNYLEVDSRPAKDSGSGKQGILKDAFIHNVTLGQETKDGEGKVSSRPNGYLKTRHYNNGDKLTNHETIIKLMSKYPKIRFQHEFKNDDHAWTTGRLEAWVATYQAAGVLGRINVSSNDLKLLRWFEANHPEVWTEAIGFFDKQPNLRAIIKAEIDQANMTYKAALRGYQGKPTYLQAARSAGVETSVRSNANGDGDRPEVWARVLALGADQIVTQGPTQRVVCNKVKRYLANSKADVHGGYRNRPQFKFRNNALVAFEKR